MQTRCPHCGEVIEVSVDLGGGATQEYIEDCSVCCRPILFHSVYSEDDREWEVTASPEI